jgi:tetratricopeptide (TPR) repeat protein
VEGWAMVWFFGMRYRILMVLALLAVAPLRAADTHWLDVESRIQYGYYTEDARALHGLIESLGTGDTNDPMKSYYAGLLAYRQTLLAEAQTDHAAAAAAASKAPPRKDDRSKNDARQVVERCVNSLDQALDAQKDFADALALQSACLDRLAELGTWRAPLAGSKSASQLRKALLIAPKNPRVLLLDAISDYEHPPRPERSGGSPEKRQGRDTGDAPRSCEKFRNTAAVFDTERANVDQVPGWGAAEAYTWLGRCYLNNGDPVPARDALERALLIAPEFGQAKRLMSSITSG